MDDLHNFFQQQRMARTASDYLALPLPAPYPVTIDYDQLAITIEQINIQGQPVSYRGNFEDTFNDDHTFRNNALRAANPLSTYILGKMKGARHNLRALSYCYEMRTSYVIATALKDVHSDTHFTLKNFNQVIMQASLNTRTILSNICSTALLPFDAICLKKPNDFDDGLFLSGVLACLCWQEQFETEALMSEIVSESPGIRSKFARSTMQVTEELREAKFKFTVPEPSHAVTMTEATIHALTYKDASPSVSGSVLRHRILFDTHPI